MKKKWFFLVGTTNWGVQDPHELIRYCSPIHVLCVSSHFCPFTKANLVSVNFEKSWDWVTPTTPLPPLPPRLDKITNLNEDFVWELPNIKSKNCHCFQIVFCYNMCTFRSHKCFTMPLVYFFTLFIFINATSVLFYTFDLHQTLKK